MIEKNKSECSLDELSAWRAKELEAEQLIRQGLEEYSQGNYECAKNIFRRAVDTCPLNTVAWVALGKVYDGLDSFGDAASCYGIAQILEPENKKIEDLRNATAEKFLNYIESTSNLRILQLENELDDVWKQFEINQQSVKEEQEKNKELEGKIAQYKTKEQQIVEAASAAKIQLNQLKEKSREEIADLKVSYETQINFLETQINLLRAELENELIRYVKTAKDLLDGIQSAEAQYLTEVEPLEARLEDKSKRVEQLYQAVQMLKQQLPDKATTLEDEVRIMSEEVNLDKEKIDGLRKQYSEWLEPTRAQLTRTLARAESLINADVKFKEEYGPQIEQITNYKPLTFSDLNIPDVNILLEQKDDIIATPSLQSPAQIQTSQTAIQQPSEKPKRRKFSDLD